MTKILRISAFCLLLIVTTRCFSQDSSANRFIGSWRLQTDISDFQPHIPTKFGFACVNNSMVTIVDQLDTLNFAKIIAFDSTTVRVKNLFWDDQAKKYSEMVIAFTGNKQGNVLYARYELPKQKFLIQYSFETECCDHKPMHCADNPTDLQKLKASGCKGFHKPQ